MGIVRLEQPKIAPYLSPTEHMKTNIRHTGNRSCVKPSVSSRRPPGRTTLKTAAKKLMRAKAELSGLTVQWPSGRSCGLPWGSVDERFLRTARASSYAQSPS